ncbi:drosomycin [Drosophila takahashii]|uniref:drosomycin n=1 Tax=Drosophila takahashii TaxID=29030 RepID=UPI001CF80E19|nr:drosomycin [Drosophila takahashii]
MSLNKSLFVVLAVLAIVLVMVAHETSAYDCLSGKFSGPCWAWDGEQCRRLCIEEGHVSGHCSASLKCWCEGC